MYDACAPIEEWMVLEEILILLELLLFPGGQCRELNVVHPEQFLELLVREVFLEKTTKIEKYNLWT